MKKLFLTLVITAMSASIFATVTRKCWITLTSDSDPVGTDVLKFYENTDRNHTFENSYDVSKLMNKAYDFNVNIYVRVPQYVPNDSMATVMTNDIENYPISIETNELTENYTFTFSNLMGEVYLFDSLENKEIQMTENGKYAFTAPKNVIISNRFRLGKRSECTKVRTEFAHSLCENQLPYEYQGTHSQSKVFTINSDTTILDTIADGAASGCDSIATVHFLINRVEDSIEDSKTICEGSSFIWHGHTCDTDSTYRDTVRYKATGCDSVYYSMTVTIQRFKGEVNRDTTICDGSSFTWHGQVCDMEKTYFDTVRYAKTGCDSAYYAMKVKVNKVVDELQKDTVICEGSSFEWRGKLCDADSTYRDTVRYKKTGCDSAYYSMRVTVNKVVDVSKEDTVICEGSSFIWHGQRCDADSTYRDTIRYAQTGCDSVVYSMLVRVVQTRFDTIATDPMCLKEAKQKYPELKITGSGTYIDTVITSLCDYYKVYFIQILSKPAMPDIKKHIHLMPVNCGENLQPKTMLDAVKAEAASQPSDAPFVDIWLEAKMNGQTAYQKVDAQTKVESTKAITFRLGGISECQDTVIGAIVSSKVKIPTPETNPELDSMYAVSKYNKWLLMIHNRQITDSGFVFTENDVEWYKVVGTVDSADNIVDDTLLVRGYYYSDDKSLEGQYYALIRDHSTDCGRILRTLVINCSSEEEMELTPRTVRRGGTMTLYHLDPMVTTSLSVYNMNGQLMYSKSVQGVSHCPIETNMTAGLYILRAENEGQTESYKFIITH